MEIPYTVSARPDTGLWNAKIGIWLFLASEVMLFGGLFSSYIFLRLGADYHWPVHELNVKMGCFNTAILIGSSVTIVMAWAGVKMRNYKMYFFNLLATILCAFGFLGVKFFEYKTKIEHYGVVLKDGTIMLGHLPDEGYRLKFNVETLTLSTDPLERGRLGSDPSYYARFAAKPATEHGGEHEEHGSPAAEAIDLFSVKFKTEQGTEVTLQDWPRLRQEALDHQPAIDSIKLTAVTPLALNADPHKLTGYDATSMTFLDSSKVTGKLVDDTMELHVDVVDVRSAPTADTSVAWSLLSDKEWKHAFDEQVEHHKHEFEAGKHHGEDPEKSEEFIREAYRWQIHGATPADHEAKHKAGEGFFDDMPWAHHHYPTVKIPAKDIERWSNFLPAWNTYYAIYFCITGLHGAHVLAGALVMLYFLLFNSSWFKKDPEHLANRVETGGLFWHFVDLVWIFLFPLLYLL